MKLTGVFRHAAARLFHIDDHPHLRFTSLSGAHLPPFLLLAAMWQACQHEIAAPELPAIIPKIKRVEVEANPHNVLSAIVEVRAEDAATVFAEYGSEGLLQYRTPVFSIEGTAEIPVLGLPPKSEVYLRVVAGSASGHQTRSEVLTFATPALPEGFPLLSVLTNQTSSSGFVMMGFTAQNETAKPVALIIDNNGQTVWYREFSGAVLDFQKQTGGSYTAHSTLNGDPPHFYELDALGNVRREFRAGNGRDTGVHELRLFEDRHCLYGVEFREMDLTALGGRADATVRGVVIEYHRLNQAPFFWNAFDHLQVQEAMPDINLQAAQVNPWHSNAIEIDRDGHLLVSFRNSDTVLKINSQTGAIIWRLGGRNNQFAFAGDPLHGFSHQHGIRRLDNGNIILFDNGNLHSPPASRAVEYALDENAKTATMVWEYRPDPPLFGNALGFAQRLANGNTLICFGTAQRIVEVDRAGVKVWELKIEEANRFAYRAFRIDSLY